MVENAAARQSAPRRRFALGDRIMSFRDQMLMDPAFQRWAARFPLTRLIARRQARSAFDLCAGFVYAQVLHATVRLGVLESIKSGPCSEVELLQRIALPEARARLLIDAAAALGLLSRRSGGRIGLGMLGAAIVANPGIAAMIEHHALLYADLADPVALLDGTARETRLARFWPYSGSGDARQFADADVASYSALMTRSQSMIAGDIADAYPFSRHHSILDVGGGEGEFLLSLAQRVKEASFHLFDLPAVVERARSRIALADMTGRISATSGSFLLDELPRGCDLITLVRIIHDHDDDRVMALLGNVRRALLPGGMLLVAEPMSATPDAHRVADVYFAFYLLAMGRGRPRSMAQITRLLEAAGFRDVRPVSTARPMLVSMLVAT